MSVKVARRLLCITGLLVVGGTHQLLLLGCEGAQRRDENEPRFFTAGLLDGRKNLVPPLPPAPPQKRISKEEFVNVPVKFSGSGPPVIFAQKRVSVVGAIGVVGDRDRVRKYVTDAMLHRLSTRNVAIVDREYADFLVKEADRVEEGKAKVTSEAEKAKRVGEMLACDYNVFVHIVQDGSEARPERVRLPVEPAEWARYQNAVADYERRYAQYVASVNDWNVELARFIDAGAGRIANYASENPYRGLVVNLDNEGAEGNGDPGAARVAEARAALIIALKSRRGLEPVAPLPMQPVASDPTKEAPEVLVTIHQFSVSVRVVDVATSKVVWFGVAEAQNLSNIEAVKQCCEEIVRNLVDDRK